MSEVVKQSEFEDEPLRWLAFRYISDEMSDAEVAEFEARLNPDSARFELEACKAVSRAVQLSDVIAEVVGEEAVGPAVRHTSPPENFSRVRRDVFARRVSLLAASIAVAVAGWALTTSSAPEAIEIVNHPAPLPVEDSSDVSGELVQLWADSGDELLTAVEEAQIQPVDDSAEFVSDDVPDWLLAAVQSHDTSSASHEVMEN